MFVVLLFLQSKNILIPHLLPGKLFQAAVYPTISTGKESKVPAKIEIKSTCGCPVDEATLRQTEMTGKPTDIVLTQVVGSFWRFVYRMNSLVHIE